jgi:hypothetical protein
MWPVVGLAYIGPGMGAGVIATALGFVGAILLGLFAVLYYPIKRMIKRKNKEQTQMPKDEANGAKEDPTEN